MRARLKAMATEKMQYKQRLAHHLTEKTTFHGPAVSSDEFKTDLKEHAAMLAERAKLREKSEKPAVPDYKPPVKSAFHVHIKEEQKKRKEDAQIKLQKGRIKQLTMKNYNVYVSATYAPAVSKKKLAAQVIKTRFDTEIS